MSKYEATFEIADKTDAHAVRLLLERAYDAVREELDQAGGNDQLNEVLREFEKIHEASKQSSAGRLTIIYEQSDRALER